MMGVHLLTCIKNYRNKLRIPMKVLPEFLTLEEVAKVLRVAKSTMYRIVSQRQIPFFKIGRHIRFDPKDILEYLKKSRTTSRDEWR